MGNKPTAEFRQEVMRVALTSGLSRKQVGSDFGIGFSTLRCWIKEERDTVSTPEPQIDLIHENERLRKEVRMLRGEREILKRQHSSSRSKNREV
jgi:transposase